MAPTSKAFAYNVNANSSSDPLGPMSFYLNNPGNVTNVGLALPNFVAAADWANGKWYGVTYSTYDLIQLDTATGNYTTIGVTGIVDLTSLAWDRTTGTMYSVSFSGNLYSIDMTTGSLTYIDATIPFIICMAVTSDGTLYGIDVDNDKFGSINKTTGAWTTISSLPFDANFAQDMAIDWEDNKIYYAAWNVSAGGQLWTIDHVSGVFTYIDDFEGGMHVAGFAIPCQEWLTVDPLAGIIGPYGSANINAHYNATGLSSGDYYANLNIYFSNPDSTITVPVHLTVGEPEINVEPTTIYLHPTHPLPPPPPVANTIDQPGAPVTGPTQNTKKESYIQGQMLIKFSDDVIVNEGRAVTNYDLINELLREYRITKMKQLFKQNGINEALKKEMGLHSIYVVNFPKSRDVFTVVNAFKALRQVVYAEPDYLAYADIIPPDPMFPDQWALQNTGQVVPAGRTVGTPGADIGAVMAWDMETGNSSVTVAVIDEGVDLTHPEFAGRLLPGYDFFNDDSDPSPFQNDAHGTACAGIVGAAQDGVGVVGVAWGVNILPVKVMELGGGPWSAISGGIVFSADQGADILSMSLGGTSYSSTLNSAINYASTSGAVLIAAAGNDNTDNGIVPHYPASFSNVISIGALSPCNNRKTPSTCDGETGWGSNYGGGLDFLAPGVRIPTTDIMGSAGYSSTNYIATFNGTSSACPHAAGVAALVLSHNPLLSSSSVRYLLQSSCVDLGVSGYDDDTGYGRLDAYMALLYAGGANSFEIFNNGTGPLTVTSITDNQDWLSTNIPPGPGQTISTSSRGAEGATWDEVVAFNDVLLYNNEGVESSTGRAPGDKKPIILENPNPDFRGMASNAFAFNANSKGSPDPQGPMSFNLTSPEDVTIIGPDLYNSDFVSCAAWANGIWYGVTFNGDSLITLDTTNGSYFKIAQTTHAEAMAWDPTTNTMYISKWNEPLSVSELYTIDLITGVTTLIGSNSVLIIGMACTNEGDLYAIDIFNDEFGSVNKATAAWTPISSLPFNANFTQDLTIDREDNKFYYAAYNYSVGAGQLWTIDHLSGVLSYISTFEGGMMVCGFIIPTNLGRKIQPNSSLLVNTFIDWNLIGTTRSRSTGTVTILSDDGDEPTVTVTVNVSTDSIRSNTVIEDDTIHNTEDECFEGQYVIIAGGNGKTFVVENGGSATLVAGRKIFLKPGVKVEQGGYLHAYISSDGLYCPSSPPAVPEALDVSDDLFSEIDSKGNSYIEAYPNPTTGHLTVNIITEGDPWTCLLEIYDFTGRRLIARQLQTNEAFEFDLSSYKNGIYFIKATWGGHMGIKRVVKN